VVESAGERSYGVEAAAKVMVIVEEVRREGGPGVWISILFSWGGVEVCMRD
jgi:hypothetical protein